MSSKFTWPPCLLLQLGTRTPSSSVGFWPKFMTYVRCLACLAITQPQPNARSWDSTFASIVHLQRWNNEVALQLLQGRAQPPVNLSVVCLESVSTKVHWLWKGTSYSCPPANSKLLFWPSSLSSCGPGQYSTLNLRVNISRILQHFTFPIFLSCTSASSSTSANPRERVVCSTPSSPHSCRALHYLPYTLSPCRDRRRHVSHRPDQNCCGHYTHLFQIRVSILNWE